MKPLPRRLLCRGPWPVADPISRQEVITALKCRGMQLGNFEYTAAPLALGASGGNQFELTLRDVDGATTDQVCYMRLDSIVRRKPVVLRRAARGVLKSQSCTWSSFHVNY